MFNHIKLLSAICVCISFAFAQTNTNQPHIGYLYPAGGQIGTTIHITAAGQFLGGAKDVYISGNGVHATVIKHVRSGQNFNKDERDELQKRLESVWNKRMTEIGVENSIPLFGLKRVSQKQENPEKENDPNKQYLKKIDHPLLYDLENKSIRELINIREMLFFPREKRQQNRQFAECLIIKITIDPNAEPGNRELRILTKQGMTNPFVLQISDMPEINGLEAGNQKLISRFPELAEILKEKPLNIPVVLNGQIMPGDIDRFRFGAKAGQKLVIQTHARSLNPYLADAVPGWFQAVTALYDANAKEIAYDDDYRFNPDPVMFYKIPANGEYELEIRDSIYRGREDFVYRIYIGEMPFITQVFPLGGAQEIKTIASIDGWNLNQNRLMLDTSAGDENIRKAFCKNETKSNPILYMVNNLPECNETESNNNFAKSQQINLPVIINGRIAKAGDIDMFRFKGSKGQKISAEVYARRLNSPIDSLLRLVDESGKVLQWNDDFSVVEKDYLYTELTGTMTHHADSYLCSEIPADGNYYIQISDTQNHGAKAYNYRLRISEPRPDFAIRVTPSTLNIRPGSSAVLNVYALRQDGYDGEIELSLTNVPEGFSLSGGIVPAGKNNIRMTIFAGGDLPAKPFAIQFIAKASIDVKKISHAVVPCEDMMQAFLYRHLVPSQQIIAAPLNVRFPAPSFKQTFSVPLKIKPGQPSEIIYKISNRPIYKQMKFQLCNPPACVTIQDVNITSETLKIKIAADENLKPLTDNLIIEISMEDQQSKGKNKNQKQTQFIGVLPAIPFIIESES